MTPTILLIDDDPNLLDSLRRQLRGEGYRIRCARSAEEALLILRSDPVDAVVSDCRLDGLQGTDLLKLIRRQSPDVIRMLLTGHASVETLVHAVNEGGVAKVYQKPCEGETIGRGLRELFDERDARRERIVRLAHDKKMPGEAVPLGAGSGTVVVEELPFGYDTLIRRIGEESGKG
jgi:DNA-binding NtrC family response regulator